MPTLAEALDPNAPVYGFYPHLNPKVANKPDTLNTPEAKGKLAETLLSMAPGSGEAMSLRDAWNASGKGAQALTGGNYGQAASEYGNLATALLASLPGAGVIARGTKRGAEWMNQNLPTGVNKLVDAMMPADPKNTLNIFAGPTAKTADTAALAKAEELAAAGASRDDIWNETGWFKGTDGKWRFEIDDSTAGLKNDEQFIAEFGPSKGQAVNRFEGLDHAGLKEAYPWLADEFSFAGAYAPGNTPLGVFSPNSRMEVTARTPEEARSIALHEHQHAIQGKEGFDSGANPQATARFRDDMRHKVEEVQPKLTRIENEASDEANALLRNSEADPAAAKRVNEIHAKWSGRVGDVDRQEALQFEMLESHPTYNSLATELSKAHRTTLLSPRQLYEMNAGEVEARNVQARMNMTPEERRKLAPWLTQDVPDEMQIIPR